ncbi:MAG: hypothetical protein ACREMN_14480 [Gemmatimonadales bacterium]
MSRGLRAVTVGLLLAALLACESRGSPPARTLEAFRGPPSSFEANRGQTDPRVHFLARGSGHTVFLTASEAVFVLTEPDSTGLVLRMTFVGANSRPRVVGLEELPGKANYFVGRDSTQWHTNVPLYARVQYSRLYPGIDLRYAAEQRHLEYEFLVHAGADPTPIVLDWRGADSVVVDAGGDLVLHTAVGVARLQKPVISQDVGARHAVPRRKIAGGYVRTAAHQVRFEVAAHDASRPLVISGTVPLALLPTQLSVTR